jgi:hypothetical protein
MKLNSIFPSFKIKKDIDFQYNRIHSIEPIKIHDLSLIYPIKNSVLQHRKKMEILNIKKINKKMTLIIPYRHREEHLKIFIPYIKDYLSKQNIDSEIIVVEQTDTKPFNKAKLMNIGACYARDESDYFVFHDVDLLPENVDYSYCNYTEKLFYEIKHEASIRYKKYKQTVLGGVVLVPKDIFLDINGYSNNYWQWGREDDDFFIRHILKGHIPLYDKKGKLKALEHQTSLLKDNRGKVTNEKKILKINKQLFNKNKKTYSQMKRGLIFQEQDGISTLSNFIIENILEENGVKTLGVKFE